MAIEALDTDEVRNCDFTIGERMLRIAATPIHEENGSLFGAVVLITDVTESREDLNRTRKDYVANVSHELRTPLASIRSLADALNDGMVQDEKDRKRYYGYILRERYAFQTLSTTCLNFQGSRAAALRSQRDGLNFMKLHTMLRTG